MWNATSPITTVQKLHREKQESSRLYHKALKMKAADRV
jgi:hypothetical protein